jgi:hypothetical protein
MDIWMLIETTIRPLLLAAGYQPETLKEAFGEPS